MEILQLIFLYKMLKEYSQDYKTLILLRVVRKLIMNTESYGIYRLEKILKDKVEEELIRKGIIRDKRSLKPYKTNKQKVQQIYDSQLLASKKIDEDFVISELDRVVKKTNSGSGPLLVPPRKKLIEIENALPPHLEYLKPTKSEYKVDLDLKKLNSLIQDQKVKVIECEGENEKIVVTGSMGRKPTPIFLSSEEINEIINIFSNISKIPVSAGLFKVTVGHLEFSAMISQTISSRFIIRKI